VQGDDLFLDGALGHQPVDGHRPLLADAVRPVRRLILHRRVPPRVHVDDKIGGGEIQRQATRLQAGIALSTTNG